MSVSFLQPLRPAQAAYDTTRAQTGSAFISYFDRFIGDRLEQNRAIMRQQLATSSPEALTRQMEILRRSIANLNSEKAKIRRAIVEGNADIVAGIARGLGSIKRAEIEGSYDLAETKTKVAADMEVAFTELAAQRLEQMGLPERVKNGADLTAEKAVSGGAARPGAYAGAVLDQIRQQYANASGGEVQAGSIGAGGSPKSHAVAYEFYTSLKRKQASTSDPEASARITEALKRVRQEHFGGDDPDTFMRTHYGLETDKERDMRVNQLLRFGGAGADASGMYREAQALLGVDFDPDDPESATASIDKQITKAEAELEALRLRQQQGPVGSGQYGSPFFNNYALENPFVSQHRRQGVVDAIAETRGRELQHAAEMRQRYGSVRGAMRQMEDPANYDGFEAPRSASVMRSTADVMDPGQLGVLGWIRGQVTRAQAMAATDPVTAAGVLARLAVSFDSMPDDLQRSLPDIDGKLDNALDAIAEANRDGPEDLAKAVGEITADLGPTVDRIAASGRDIHGGEVVAMALEQVFKAGTPLDQVKEAQRVASLVGGLPPELVGDWAEIVPQRINSNLRREDGRALLSDIKVMAEGADRWATMSMDAPLGADRERLENREDFLPEHLKPDSSGPVLDPNAGPTLRAAVDAEGNEYTYTDAPKVRHQFTGGRGMEPGPTDAGASNALVGTVNQIQDKRPRPNQRRALVVGGEAVESPQDYEPITADDIAHLDADELRDLGFTDEQIREIKALNAGGAQ